MMHCATFIRDGKRERFRYTDKDHQLECTRRIEEQEPTTRVIRWSAPSNTPAPPHCVML